MAGTRTRPRGSPGQHARLWASKRCLSQLVSVSLPAASSNTECPINTLKNGVPTPCTNTHTHTHMEELMSQVLRSNTHREREREKGEAGRGDAEERPKYDKERRGRGGIEPHLERQTTASPKSQGSRDEREREAACAPLGEQALSLAACFCFITGLVVEYGISDRLYPKSRP